MTLHENYLHLYDGSEKSLQIIAQLKVMDARRKLISEIHVATAAGDKEKVSQLRKQLFSN